LEDVVKDLPPVIKEFNESQQNRSGLPLEGGSENKQPVGAFYTDTKVDVGQPTLLPKFVEEHLEEIK
jgi:hypothetical protein